MKRIETKLEKIAKSQKVGLWRSHPSFFWLMLGLTIENFIVGAALVFSGRQYFAGIGYDPVFEFVPTTAIGLMFLTSAILMTIAFVTRRSILVKIAVPFALVPTVMFVTAFVFLTINNRFFSITAVTKWTFVAIVYARALSEPFVNPNSAR